MVLLPPHRHGVGSNLEVLSLLCAHSTDNYSEEEYESFSSEQEASDDAVQGQVKFEPEMGRYLAPPSSTSVDQGWGLRAFPE